MHMHMDASGICYPVPSVPVDPFVAIGNDGGVTARTVGLSAGVSFERFSSLVFDGCGDNELVPSAALVSPLPPSSSAVGCSSTMSNTLLSPSTPSSLPSPSPYGEGSTTIRFREPQLALTRVDLFREGRPACGSSASLPSIFLVSPASPSSSLVGGSACLVAHPTLSCLSSLISTKPCTRDTSSFYNFGVVQSACGTMWG